MKVFLRTFLFAALLAAPLLLGPAGRWAVFGFEPPGNATDERTVTQQFYARVLGDWVGSTVSRVNEDAPVTGYFHLVITRVDANTFREEYIFYRVLSDTGALERSGTQTFVTTIASDGTIQRSYRGSGTILIDGKPKKQSFEASGAVRSTGPDHLEAEGQGKISVAGMPLNAGKNGKLLKATTTLSREEDTLSGATRFEASFRVLFFSKRYRIDIKLRGQRGDKVQTIAGRTPAS
jgi:hypothetical protein